MLKNYSDYLYKRGGDGMRSKALLMAIVFILVLSLSGCSFANLDTGNLMRPPRSGSGDIEKIQRAIESTVGTEIVYKYPRRGDYRYAIVQYDIDGDNQREAITFFREKSDLNSTIIMILDQTENGGWQPIVNTIGLGTEVDRLMFHDFDGDGVSEIIVGWYGYSANMNTASVYKYSDGNFLEIRTVQKSISDSMELHESVQANYSEMVLCNLNGIGSKELVFVELNTGTKQAKAKIFEFSSGMNDSESELVMLDTVALDGNVVGYSSCTVGRVSESTNAVIISGQAESGLIRTELLLYDSLTQKYTAPLSGEDYVAKYSRYSAMDINGDSITEIPTDTVLPGYSEENKEYMTSWNIYATHYAPTFLRPVLNAVHNYEDGYYIKLETDWIYDLTARTVSGDHTMYFHLIDRTSGSTELVGSELFRISVCNKEEWSKYEQLGFQILKENNGKVYSALIIENMSSSINITYNDLINNFQLIGK